MEEYKQLLEKKMLLGEKSNVIIKNILIESFGELGELYYNGTIVKNTLNIETWELKGGNSDIYNECKNIASTLFQHAVNIYNKL